jgi:hypothetical protein
VISADTSGCRLDTAFGELVGASRVAMHAGSMANLAVPAEAIDVLPGSTPLNYFPEIYGGNPVKGTVESIQQVGHIIQLIIIIGGAQPIVVEGHADKYGGRFQGGEEVLLAWKKDAATLISR